MVDLGGYKWYQSQTLDGVPARTLDPKGGVDFEIPCGLEKGTSASEDVEPRREWIVRSHIIQGVERSILYKV